jgi:hypothetical protein
MAPARVVFRRYRLGAGIWEAQTLHNAPIGARQPGGGQGRVGILQRGGHQVGDHHRHHPGSTCLDLAQLGERGADLFRCHAASFNAAATTSARAATLIDRTVDVLVLAATQSLPSAFLAAVMSIVARVEVDTFAVQPRPFDHVEPGAQDDFFQSLLLGEERL